MAKVPRVDMYKSGLFKIVNAFNFSVACLVLFAIENSNAQTVKIAPVPKSSQQLTRIAFGSCAKHWQHQVIWEQVIKKRPDLFLFLGDAIYADTDGTTAWEVSEKQLLGEWNRLADKPEFARFRSRVPIMATWDNHDYGTHNGGADFKIKNASKRIFLDFFDEPKDSERRQREGIYDARIFGSPGKRLQIILLDTRTFRGPFQLDSRSKKEREKIGKVGKYVPTKDTDAQILGDDQWKWLEKQLGKPAELRLVCSSTQIIPNQKGMDEWGCFPHERQRLFDLLKRTNAGNTILLTGNAHFAEISKTENRGNPLFEFTSSGLTHVNESYAKAENRFRVAGPSTELNFGLVEIEWESKPIRVRLTAVGVKGTSDFARSIQVNSSEKN